MINKTFIRFNSIITEIRFSESDDKPMYIEVWISFDVFIKWINIATFGNLYSTVSNMPKCDYIYKQAKKR